MYFTILLWIAALTSAAAVLEPVPAVAQPGSPVRRAEATTGPITVERLVGESNVVVTVSVTTDAPAANVMRVEGDASSSACTPASICMDGITCGIRFGGCYDNNFCAGSTSFPMPTCTDDPSSGLTQNFRKRMEAQAGAQ